MPHYPRATSQKQLVKEQVSELFVVQNPQTSVANALEFLKKMTVIAVSSITFIRKLFPEDAFADKQLEGQPIKILRGFDHLPQTKTMINWLKYAFDLVSKQYLRKIVFVIEQENSNEKSTGQTIETYTFFYDYNEEAICYQLVSEEVQQELSLNSVTLPHDIAASVSQLLRSVSVMTSTLAPLPSNACEFSLRLELNENVPDDFKPSELYKAIDSYDISFPSDTNQWKLGKVPTKFTSFTVSAKSVYLQLNEEKEHGESEEDSTKASHTAFRPLSSDMKLSYESHIEINTSTDTISLRLSSCSVQEVSSPMCEYKDQDNDVEIIMSPMKRRKTSRYNHGKLSSK